jgi:hypothetical protein
MSRCQRRFNLLRWIVANTAYAAMAMALVPTHVAGHDAESHADCPVCATHRKCGNGGEGPDVASVPVESCA